MRVTNILYHQRHWTENKQRLRYSINKQGSASWTNILQRHDRPRYPTRREMFWDVLALWYVRWLSFPIFPLRSTLIGFMIASLDPLDPS